jgi:hypothetical protein
MQTRTWHFVGQIRVCNVKYVLDHVNRRDGYSIKNASNANVVQVVLLDANSYFFGLISERGNQVLQVLLRLELCI